MNLKYSKKEKSSTELKKYRCTGATFGDFHLVGLCQAQAPVQPRAKKHADAKARPGGAPAPRLRVNSSVSSLSDTSMAGGDFPSVIGMWVQQTPCVRTAGGLMKCPSGFTHSTAVS